MDARMKKRDSYQQRRPHNEPATSGSRFDSGHETSSSSSSSSSSAYEDSLNSKLSKFLKMESEDFYKTVILDESLEASLCIYLQKNRQFANFGNENGKPLTRIIAGDELYRRVFMVFYRMSLMFERGTIDSLSTKKHPDTMYSKRFFNIPKLLDICILYGHENPVLTRQLVHNALTSIKQLHNDLANVVASLSTTIHAIYQLCLSMMDEQTSKSMILKVQDELIEMLTFVINVLISIHALVDIYPDSAKILVHQSNEKFEILRIFAAMHDTLLPTVRKALSHLGGSIAEIQMNHLRRLRFKSIEIVWRILSISYLSDIDAVIGNDMGISQNGLYNPLARGEEFLQALSSMVEGPSDFPLMEDFVNSGALLRNIEKKYKLLDRVNNVRKRGMITLDGAQYDYIEGIIGHSFSAMGSITLPDCSVSKSPQIPEDDILYESKITHIKDILPDYGRGFIAACLEAYNDDPEEVIQRILEGTLHPSLESLDISLEKKPEVSASSMSAKDKGKGKIDETHFNSSKDVSSAKGGNHDAKPPNMATKGKGKGKIDETLLYSSKDISSSKGGLHDANGLKQRQNSSMSASSSSVQEGGINSPLRPPFNEHDKHLRGRFIRKSNGDANATDLLDIHDVEDTLRTVAYATQYDDEYDDSFDDLNTNIADGIEETEALADRLKSRLSLEDPSGGRNNWVDKDSRHYQNATSTSGNTSSGSRESMQKAQLPLERGRGDGGGSGGRGKSRGRGEKPKGQFFVKDGKNYSYKVAGSVPVANVKEAEDLARVAEETIHGLGRGGNVPTFNDQPTSTQKRNISNQTDDDSMHGPVSGHGRSVPHTHGRGGPRRGYDQHHRKDRAMKKHFSSIGGL